MDLSSIPLQSLIVTFSKYISFRDVTVSVTQRYTGQIQSSFPVSPTPQSNCYNHQKNVHGCNPFQISNKREASPGNSVMHRPRRLSNYLTELKSCYSASIVQS